MEAVRKWEESETTGAKVRQISLSEDSVQKAQEEQAFRRVHEGQALCEIIG